MRICISTKGQIVLPVPLLRRLGLRASDALVASIQDGRIVLARQPKAALRPRVIAEPLLGTPVLGFGRRAPKLTSDDVDHILAEFP